jgi:hypothetical protein
LPIYRPIQNRLQKHQELRLSSNSDFLNVLKKSECGIFLGVNNLNATFKNLNSMFPFTDKFTAKRFDCQRRQKFGKMSLYPGQKNHLFSIHFLLAAEE